MTEARDHALEFVHKINEGDLDGLVDLMTEDHAFIDNSGVAQHGREVMRRAWRAYFDSFPEYRIHVGRVVTLGDVVVIVGRTTGSHIPHDVEALQSVIWGALVEGELIREWHILYMDTEKARRLLAADADTAGED